MCCPSGETTAVTPNVPSTCEPDSSAPLEDTTMGFSYYDVETVGQTTEFQFKVCVCVCLLPSTAAVDTK